MPTDQREADYAECRRENHDFEIVQHVVDGEPVRLVCMRCGRLWTVSEGRGGVTAPNGPLERLDGA